MANQTVRSNKAGGIAEKTIIQAKLRRGGWGGGQAFAGQQPGKRLKC